MVKKHTKSQVQKAALEIQGLVSTGVSAEVSRMFLEVEFFLN